MSKESSGTCLSILIGLILVVPLTGWGLSYSWRLLLFAFAGLVIALLLKNYSTFSKSVKYIFIVFFTIINIWSIIYSANSKTEKAGELIVLNENIPDGILNGKWKCVETSLTIYIKNDDEVFLSLKNEESVEYTIIYSEEGATIEGFLEEDRFRLKLLSLSKNVLKTLDLNSSKRLNFERIE